MCVAAPPFSGCGGNCVTPSPPPPSSLLLRRLRPEERERERERIFADSDRIYVLLERKQMLLAVVAVDTHTRALVVRPRESESCAQGTLLFFLSFRSSPRFFQCVVVRVESRPCASRRCLLYFAFFAWWPQRYGMIRPEIFLVTGRGKGHMKSEWVAKVEKSGKRLSCSITQGA